MTRKVLFLTDHSSHVAYDSIYALPRIMAEYDDSISVFITSRSISVDHFDCRSSIIDCIEVDDNFYFENRDVYFDIKKMDRLDINVFDLIFIRIDRPIREDYLLFLKSVAPNAKYVNSPDGILETSSKSFLTHFRDICPPFKICNSLDDVVQFSSEFPVVLKPLDGYGGKGLIRFYNIRDIWVENKQLTGYDAISYSEQYISTKFPYLAMKYLTNVRYGDKRILVVAGECLGAVLRVPKQDSWICNMSHGATSEFTSISSEEHSIVATVDPVLRRHGILLYGIDTLVDDSRKRVLSEINTTNAGGFIQLEERTGQPIIQRATKLIFDSTGIYP